MNGSKPTAQEKKLKPIKKDNMAEKTGKVKKK